MAVYREDWEVARDEWLKHEDDRGPFEAGFTMGRTLAEQEAAFKVEEVRVLADKYIAELQIFASKLSGFNIVTTKDAEPVQRAKHAYESARKRVAV